MPVVYPFCLFASHSAQCVLNCRSYSHINPCNITNIHVYTCDMLPSFVRFSNPVEPYCKTINQHHVNSWFSSLSFNTAIRCLSCYCTKCVLPRPLDSIPSLKRTFVVLGFALIIARKFKSEFELVAPWNLRTFHKGISWPSFKQSSAQFDRLFHHTSKPWPY